MELSDKTSGELFLASFEGDYEDERSWDSVAVLRLRNSDEVFELALAYSRSEKSIHRSRALDVLGQLGAGKPLSERPHFDECVSIAVAHLDDEDPVVVNSAAWALAHLRDERAVTALIDIRHSSNSGARWAVAYGVAGSERPEAIHTLIELMKDQNDDVRDWATCGLGQFGDRDSAEIREALRDRLNDPFKDVRAEAMWGLALRRDPAGLQILSERLDAETWTAGDEQAAAHVLGLAWGTPNEELRNGLRNLLFERTSGAKMERDG